ncbi:MAG: ATP-binding cassette domain-containing protein [Paracoccaceae bacterium]
MSRVPRVLAGERRRGIALVAALALGQAAATGVAAFATRDVFAAMREAAAGVPAAALWSVFGAGAAVALLRYAERVVAERVGQDYAAALRAGLFRHMTRVPAREVANRRSGALAMRFVGDLSAARGWVSLGVARLVSASVVLPAATGVLFALDPALGAAAALPVVLGLAAMALAGPALGPAHRRLRARRARLAADMSERLPHAPELHLLGRVGIEMDRLERRTERMIVSAVARARGAAFLRAVPDAVSGAAAAGVLWTALLTGAPAATAAGALAAVGLMIQPMRDLAGVWDRYRAWCAARDKCAALLSVERLPQARRGGAERDAPDAPPPLRFEGVRAGLLRDIDAEAAPGRRIAVLGPNGAGKSTLLALAAGLEAPEAGRVLLGARPPTDLAAAERRRLIAFVSLRSPILAGSLRRALTMGAPERPDDAAVIGTAEAFGLGAVLHRLGGLDGRLAEGGRNLSTGEARRVLLARAALSRPRLLLLDEPDEALDRDALRLVHRLITGTAATTLVITHEPALARAMDEAWFLRNGRLEAVGPPDALIGRIPAGEAVPATTGPPAAA